jgi:transcriptional regulator with PAS, ATPase and Fis domain
VTPAREPSGRSRVAGERGPTERVGGGESEPAAVRRFRLEVEAGPDAGTAYDSGCDPVVVGTHESCQVVLRDRTVSRFHCEIQVVEGQATLRDLGSSNGTMVDGVAVMQARLHTGARLVLGRSRLRFDLGTTHAVLPQSAQERFGLVVGRCARMRAVLYLLERAAQSEATVLLGGETGTGKEMAAESIHQQSARRAGPFVAVDCGAIVPSLLESELFGHERGAFTGAAASRAGAFLIATGGTVFLDEVGELPAELQPVLLRALERREIKPVGANRYQRVNVRVIAASNRNLRAEVNARRFRPDLYYRLAVLPIVLPPLRERLEDLPLLVPAILEDLGGATADPDAAHLASPASLAELATHAWPGNVRELRNHLVRSLALRQRQPVDGGATTPAVANQPAQARYKEARREFERHYLVELLERHHGNVSAAARAAGLERMYLHRLLRRHGLR